MSTSQTYVGKKCLSAFTLEMKRKLKYLKNKMGIADRWRYYEVSRFNLTESVSISGFSLKGEVFF